MASFTERWRYRIRNQAILIFEVLGYCICCVILAGFISSWFIRVNIEESTQAVLSPTAAAARAEHALVVTELLAEDAAAVTRGAAVLTVRESPLSYVISRIRAAAVETPAAGETELRPREAALLQEIRAATSGWQDALLKAQEAPITIGSPSDGLLHFEETTRVGAGFDSGQTMFTVVDMDTLEGEATVAEDLLSKLTVDAPVRTSLGSDKKKKVTGRVKEIRAEEGVVVYQFALDDEALRAELLEEWRAKKTLEIPATVTVVADRVRLFYTIFN